MGDSLQNYRMTIGLFLNPAQKRNLTSKAKCGISSCKVNHYSRFLLLTLLLTVLMVIFGLNVFLTAFSEKSTSSCVSHPGYYSSQLRKVDYNFLARYRFGNKSKAGLRLAHINLDGGFLVNNMAETYIL